MINIKLFIHMVVFLSIFSIYHMSPLSYLHGKKLMLVQLINNASMNSKNVVNNVGIFWGDSTSMNSIFIR